MIYFDVTETLASGIETGIQRVVKELGISLSQLDSTSDAAVALVALAKSGDHYDQIDSNKWRNYLPSKEISFRLCITRFIRASRLHIFIIRFLLKFEMFKRAKQRFFDENKQALLRLESQKPINSGFSQGDIFFTAESFWNDSENLKRFAELKEGGVQICLFVHDILPMTHPHLFEKMAVKQFKSNFTPILLIADRVFVASQHVSSQLLSRFPSLEIPSVINLGSNLSNASNSLPKEFQFDSSCKSALAIGTIEPRKNYRQLLTWITKEDEEICLVIIGRRGWKSRTLYWRLHLNSKIRLLGAVSDEILADHLEKTDFGICASLDEGFGLPLREFLSRGIPVVASNIPPFHEVPDGSNIFYFELGDNKSLKRAVKEALSTPRNTNVEFPTWEDCAKELIGNLAD